jgi:hypothetical protein
MNTEKNGTPQAYPVGDFLGPDVVIWSSGSIRVPGTQFARPAAPGVITALRITKRSFSTRIGVVPVSNEDLRTLHSAYAEKPRRAQRMIALGAAYDGGRVTVTVKKPLGSRAYERVRRYASAHRLIWITGLADPLSLPNGTFVNAPKNGGAPPPATYREQERFPPLPRFLGFNIFGPLRSVRFRQVSGHLSIGDRSIDLSGGPDVELGRVRGLRNAGDEQLLSAPLATSRRSASLQFRAVGSVRVNGALQTTWLHRHGSVFEALSVAIGIIGFVLAAISFARGSAAGTRPMQGEPSS